ncbi:MAG: hypothetical protein KAS75_04310 [Planctomycetes bacterium]|nr:hypothetical protein [Planctomycetota bacterium]
MVISSKRAEYLSRTALAISVVFFTIVLLLGQWSQFFAVYAVSYFILATAMIWAVLCFQFHQAALAEQEKLDMSQLTSDEKNAAIFKNKDEHASMFAMQRRRLEIFEKWFLPGFSALIAIYQLAIGYYILKKLNAGLELYPRQPLVCAICLTAIAFVSFLISRYATGMSAQKLWKPLRAGGSLLLGTAFLCFAIAIALALSQFKIFAVINVINYVIPILLIILGAETALNIVMDIYRPRIKGFYSRSAFDSRLLGLINEPGEIFRTAASTIDYQFGFKVSQTWFYKLLEKAIVPLVLFAALNLYLLSCIVIVAPNEQAIIEHFGNPMNDAKQVRIIGPGLAFKWPWPIDIAYKYPTKMISEIYIGFTPKDDEHAHDTSLLWGKEHHEQEDMLLIASGQTDEKTGTVPVSLLITTVPIQYRVKDLYSYLYNHNEPKELFKSICYRELTRLAASTKIEVNNQDDIEKSILGAGRAQAKKILTQRIQNAVDEEGLGIEIVFLGLQGIHPPPQVAVDYQKVVGAVQKKQALILRAHAKRNEILSSLAGSVSDAEKLYELAAKYQNAKNKNDTKQLDMLEKQLDEAFAQASGEIFTTLRDAQSYSFKKATLAKATGQRFDSQLKAYRAAKSIYKRQQRLAALEETLENIRKFVIVTDENDTQVFIVDVKEKLTPSLYELGGFEEQSGK